MTNEIKQKIAGMIEKASSLEIELVWIPKIVARQTRDEIDHLNTEEKNNVGLSAFDAEIITSFYNQIQHGKHLSSNQTQMAKKKLAHYWRQYAQMMNQ